MDRFLYWKMASMEGTSFLTEFLIVLVIATFVAILFDRLKFPSLLGFLLAGVVVGPNGFGWVTDQETIHQLAEVGVALLMLSIGLEFSFDRLKGLRRLAIIGGGLQIVISILIGILFAWVVDWSLYQGIFMGSVIALSSTAIVFKFLIDRGELDTHYGRIAVAILLFQDIAVVPLMIFLRGFGGPAGQFFPVLVSSFVKVALLLGLVILFSRYLLTPFLNWMAVRRNREIFFLSSVVVCLGTAWVFGELGFSYAIGAFFAGVMFANTEYGHQLMGEVLPARHIFVAIFFVSIGLLLDLGFVLGNFWMVAGVMGMVLLINFVVMTLLVMGFGYPPRIALTAGLILSQVGEFSFLLLETVRETGEVTDFLYQLLLSVAFLTMFITPFLFMLVPALQKISKNIRIFGVPPAQWRKEERHLASLKEHIILCGFGSTGQDLAETFRIEKIPFILIEMNPRKTKEARKKKMNTIYGDAANVEVMLRANIKEAQMVIISFSDPIGMAQIIRVAEGLNTKIRLVVRTRSEGDIAHLYELGADVVITEAWEASYRIHQMVLDYLGFPPEKINENINRIRDQKELIVEKAIMGQLHD